MKMDLKFEDVASDCMLYHLRALSALRRLSPLSQLLTPFFKNVDSSLSGLAVY